MGHRMGGILMAARLTKAEIDKLNKEFNSLSEDNDDEYKRKKKIWNILNFNKRLQGEASPKISDKELTTNPPVA